MSEQEKQELQELAERMILDSIQANLTAVQAVTGSTEQRSALKAKPRVVYASSPVTTGPRMYELFRKYGARSVDELNRANPDLFKKEIMQPNLADGEQFARDLRNVGTCRYVICPATFFAKGWTQKHYMAFWKGVIERFADDVRFNNGWWQSNGCVEEFLIGLESGKVLYEGLSTEPLSPKEALRKVRRAIQSIEAIGADASTLAGLHQKLAELIAKIHRGA